MNYVIHIVELIVVSHLILIGLYFVFERNRKNSGISILGIFLILLGFQLFFISFGYVDQEMAGYQWFVNSNINSYLVFSFGPLLLLTNRAYIIDRLILHKSDLLHLISYVVPVLAQFFRSQIFGESKSEVSIFDVSFITQSLIYCIASLQYASRKKVDVLKKKILTHLNLSYSLLIVVWLSVEIVRYFGFFGESILKLGFLIGVMYLVFGLTILSLKFPDTIIQSKYIRRRLNQWKNEKYGQAQMKENYSGELIQAITKYIEQDRNYLNPDLRLNDVSHVTGFPLKDVSQAINEQIGKSFNKYLNDLRIDDAVLLFNTEEDLNAKEVMYKVGYNSKSLFYKYFKEKMGVTPLTYKKTLSRKLVEFE